MKKLVSILLVTYNSESFIKKTLYSCLNQTYKDIEILILDNYSSDRTVSLIKRQKDARLKLYQSNKNIGPYAGLNLLLKKSQGQYIAIQDHDDVWLPNKIKKQVAFLDNHAHDCIACGSSCWFYFERFKRLRMKKVSGYVDYVPHITLIFRKKNYLRYNLDSPLPEEDFQKKILGKEGKIYSIQKPLAIRRFGKDSQNLSRKRRLLKTKNLKQLLQLEKGRPIDLLNILITPILSKFPFFDQVVRCFLFGKNYSIKEFAKENPGLKKFINNTL
ncbi:MAG: glycosyltransferase family A protein [Candidatus Moranbacteria bacterium]|nr:glycosyltransferase family A protein [Candidatus Moranbacteria bacterium]